MALRLLRAGVRDGRRRLAAQIALGIATLVKGVPLALAALHQAGAVAMLAPAVVVAHALR